MSNTHMARIEVDDDAWRAFRAMCLEQGVAAAVRLGELVKEDVRAYHGSKPRPRRGSVSLKGAR